MYQTCDSGIARHRIIVDLIMISCHVVLWCDVKNILAQRSSFYFACSRRNIWKYRVWRKCAVILPKCSHGEKADNVLKTPNSTHEAIKNVVILRSSVSRSATEITSPLDRFRSWSRYTTFLVVPFPCFRSIRVGELNCQGENHGVFLEIKQHLERKGCHQRQFSWRLISDIFLPQK